jgi:aspartyl-tRNA synthetase
MVLEERLLQHALSAVRALHGSRIAAAFNLDVEVPTLPIPRISYADAVELCGGHNAGGRLSHTAEQSLTKTMRERHGHGFVFVTDFPASERPFYTMRSPNGSRSFDLFWRGMEVTSGCQREHRYGQLVAQMAPVVAGSETNAGYLTDYYLEMFKYGCPPHGGFGIGLNRLLMALLGRPSIREATFVFRGPSRFVP